VDKATARTRKIISLVSGSKEASELFDKLHADMMLEIESRVRTSGHVLRSSSVSLPFVSSDSRSRSNKRAVGAPERRAKVSLSLFAGVQIHSPTNMDMVV
jgi:hypothetical protein